MMYGIMKDISSFLRPCRLCGGAGRVIGMEANVNEMRIKVVCCRCGMTIDHTHRSDGRYDRCLQNLTAIDIWNGERYCCCVV